MPLPKPTTTQLALRLILFLIVMFAVLSSVLTLHRHLTDTSTHHHQKEIRDLNGEASLSYPGSYWSNATTRSLSARMDGHAADNHDHPPDRELLIAAAAGFQCFDLLVNDLMSQVSFRLAPEARGNGRDGWFFGPERHDHITDILHQLPDSLLSATFPHRDPDLWMNLDAAQDGPYMLADSEHAPTNAVCNGIVSYQAGPRTYVAGRMSTPWDEFITGSGTDPTVPRPFLGHISDVMAIAYGFREHGSYAPAMQLDPIETFIFPNIDDAPTSRTIRIMNLVLNMGRPAGSAPIPLRRWPGNEYTPYTPDCSAFMALLGTWQAVTVASFYGHHVQHFDFGWGRYYVSHITIFNDENDKPSMAIRVSRRPLHTLEVGAPLILPGFHDPPEGGEGPQHEPHTANGVNGVNGVNGGHLVNGANGANGVNGGHLVNGANGANGVNGGHLVNGANGANGVNGVGHGGSPPAAHG